MRNGSDDSGRRRTVARGRVRAGSTSFDDIRAAAIARHAVAAHLAFLN